MDTRRDFFKKAMLLAGNVGINTTFPKSIRKALAIDPEEGSTYMEAEHVVLLMMENRSFDHCLGALKGVRGFNDPRHITQPDGNAVWMQTNKKGETYKPFRFDINDTKATWMGSIPHSRHSQVDADNRGRYNNWLDAKRSGNMKYKEMPLTLGHYNRKDLPFHYSLADAFTVCDQNFSSAMTMTLPNRLFYYSGNIRGEMSGEVRAVLRNDSKFGRKAEKSTWKTFAEHLEDNKISWRVYQNSLHTGGGLQGEERSWLSNFGLNSHEFFVQFNARFYPRYYESLKKRKTDLSFEINNLKEELSALEALSEKFEKTSKVINKKREVLKDTEKELKKWDPKNFNNLSSFEKSLYEKAFTTNKGDSDYMKLTKLKYVDNGKEREVVVPKGDPLYQFRKDVESGELPTVSWLAPPQNFSDHPSAPWYGAWYASEVLDILTKKPEVWKKTIFLLTYDENDGYFDHIPPYVAPVSGDPATGKSSTGLVESGVEFVRRNDEIKRNLVEKSHARTGPVGLGFRVPMIIASPWSRGGKVCSELFDHTSVLQFLEHFLNKKYDKKISQQNISAWRRAICGDLTSVFDRYKADDKYQVDFLDKESHVESIYNAKFKQKPNDFRPLKKREIREINEDPINSSLMDFQESGVKTARPLPYELYVDGYLDDGKNKFVLNMEAGNRVFGPKTNGSPFKVYAPKEYKIEAETYKNIDFKDKSAKVGKLGYFEKARSWDYAVEAGGKLSDGWLLDKFKDGIYHLEVFGPNGFYREFKGDDNTPKLNIRTNYERSRLLKTILTGNIILEIENRSLSKSFNVEIVDKSYKSSALEKHIPANETVFIKLDLKNTSQWYDFEVKIENYRNFSQRYAGHVETGNESITDPLMGKII